MVMSEHEELNVWLKMRSYYSKYKIASCKRQSTVQNVLPKYKKKYILGVMYKTWKKI